MNLELEELINNNKNLKETLEIALQAREDAAKRMEKVVKKTKQKRLEDINKPHNKLKYGLGKLYYDPFRLMMILNTALSGTKNIILNEYKHVDDGKPIIYVPTHVCRYDIELVLENIKQHAVLLSGTEDRLLRTLEGTFLVLCGVNFVDRSDSVDRKIAMQKMNKDLENGLNLLIFPEATWNISENLLIQQVTYSAIDLAIKNDAEIELVAFDKEDKQIFTNFGGRLDLEVAKKFLKPIYNEIQNIENIIKSNELNENEKNKLKLELNKLKKIKKEHLIKLAVKMRDGLATLKWETMVYKEEFLQTGIKPKEYKSKEYVRKNENCDYNYYVKRETINENYWGDVVANIVKEWNITDLFEENDYIYKPKGDAYEFFEEFNSTEKNIDGKIIRKRISSEGNNKRR